MTLYINTTTIDRKELYDADFIIKKENSGLFDIKMLNHIPHDSIVFAEDLGMLLYEHLFKHIYVIKEENGIIQVKQLKGVI